MKKINKRYLKSIFYNTLLLSGSIIFSLLVIEVFLRIFIPQDIIVPMPAQADRELIYKLPPNTKAYLKGTSSRFFHLNTNSVGLRDVEHSFNKPPGVLRILLLGDSMSMAEGVELHETYIKIFEKNANAQCPKMKIETINAAIRGYGNDQELILYERIGIKYSPDYVILAFFEGNDIQDNIQGGIFVTKNGNLIQKIPTNKTSPKLRYYSKQIQIQNLFFYKFWISHSHLANFSRKVVARILLNTSFRKNKEGMKKQLFEDDSGWKLTEKILERWIGSCTRNGSIPILCYIPAKETFLKEKNIADESTRLDLKLKIFALNNEIRWINFCDTISKSINNNNIYLEDDGHLSPKGHELLADQLLKYFRDKNIICKVND